MARAKKRADGRYCSQIYLGRDENGKRKYKSVYAKTPAELKEKETSVRLQLGRALTFSPNVTALPHGRMIGSA